MTELDLRVIKISIEVNGQLKTYQNLQMSASGMKYANANQNDCEIKISNLEKATQDYILTQTTPFNLNRTPKLVIVEAGRQSYGTSIIYRGNIASASPSQPPDITLTLKCLTGNFQKGNIVSTTQTGNSKLSAISKQTADSLGLGLNFQATDKDISNYNFTGGNLKQVDKIGSAGAVTAYVDDGFLIVKDANIPLTNTLTILNLDTGMIGIPEITEQGIKVKFLLDNKTTLGGSLRVNSKIYPAVNGDYIIYKLGFDIASRDTPFYWIAEAKRVQ